MPKFKVPLPDRKVEHEFAGKVSLECSKRCLYSIVTEGQDEQSATGLNYGEQVCMNRCISKLYSAREVVEDKLKGHVEQPPILFAQNLPM